MKFNKRIIALLGAAAIVLPLAACGGGNDAAGDASGDEQIELTVWSWDSTLPRTVEGFEKENPNIKVTITNAGTNKDEYQALNKRDGGRLRRSGSGADRVLCAARVRDPRLRAGSVPATAADDFSDFFTPGTWASVAIQGGVYALPMDSGPMAWFYNKEVMDKAGVNPDEVRTWDDFYEAAKKVRATGSYITSDSGDAGFFDSMDLAGRRHPVRDRRGRHSVKINLTGDDKVQSFIDFWQKLIDEDLIDTKTAGWTDEWNRGLNDGSIASLLTGAWMPYNLLSGAPDGDGKWRIAQMPTLDGSETNSRERRLLARHHQDR